jgi:hypothetical protein
LGRQGGKVLEEATDLVEQGRNEKEAEADEGDDDHDVDQEDADQARDPEPSIQRGHGRVEQEGQRDGDPEDGEGAPCLPQNERHDHVENVTNSPSRWRG